jgi:hypothetical protein
MLGFSGLDQPLRFVLLGVGVGALALVCFAL